MAEDRYRNDEDLETNAILGDEEEKDVRKGVDKVTIIILFIMLIGNAAQSVMAKRMYNAFGTRYTFPRQILTIFQYDLQVSVWALVKIFVTKEITRDMLSFPIWMLACISLMDGSGDLLLSIGGVNTKGSWQVLIQQWLVPIVLCFSMVTMKRRYNWMQVAGAVVIVGGALVAILPAWSSNSGSIWYFVVIYTAAWIPKGMSAVSKEWCFQQATLDPIYVSAVVSILQLFLTFVFYPLTTFKSIGGLPFSQFGNTFHDAYACYFGDTSIKVYNQVGGHEVVVGHCSMFNFWIVNLFSVTGFTAGVAQLYVMQRASSGLMVMATVVGLPLANLAFGVRAFMGDEVEKISVWDIIGLLVVICGFIGYSYAEQQQVKEEKERNSLTQQSDAVNTDWGE